MKNYHELIESVSSAIEFFFKNEWESIHKYTEDRSSIKVFSEICYYVGNIFKTIG